MATAYAPTRRMPHNKILNAVFIGLHLVEIERSNADRPNNEDLRGGIAIVATVLFLNC
jgi:hypothetical protein